MQKLDYVLTLREITEKLNSKVIVQLFDNGFKQPTMSNSYAAIIPLLFDSKSQLDRLMLKNKNYQDILQCYNVEELYSVENLAFSTKILQGTHAQQILVYPATINYYLFHAGLLKTLNSVEKLFLSDNIGSNLQEDLDNGVIVFLFVNDDDRVDTLVYATIFQVVEELFASVRLIVTGEKEGKTDIVFLDSGSDTNLGIKTDIETAKGVFCDIQRNLGAYHKLYKL
jgi:hypothetical protein